MTDTITLPRSVVEQALEALEDNISYDFHGNPYEEGDELMQVTAAKLRAAMEQPQVEQDSQASAAYDMIDRYLRNSLHDDDYSEYSAALDSLYTHPQPPRQPLTEEQIDSLAMDEDGLPNSHIEFARAIERAHGIGGEK